MAQISKAIRRKCFKESNKKCGPATKAKKCASDVLKKCFAKERRK